MAGMLGSVSEPNRPDVIGNILGPASKAETDAIDLEKETFISEQLQAQPPKPNKRGCAKKRTKKRKMKTKRGRKVIKKRAPIRRKKTQKRKRVVRRRIIKKRTR